jgi:hypothetical protein
MGFFYVQSLGSLAERETREKIAERWGRVPAMSGEKKNGKNVRNVTVAPPDKGYVSLDTIMREPRCFPTRYRTGSLGAAKTSIGAGIVLWVSH